MYMAMSIYIIPLQVFSKVADRYRQVQTTALWDAACHWEHSSSLTRAAFEPASIANQPLSARQPWHGELAAARSCQGYADRDDSGAGIRLLPWPAVWLKPWPFSAVASAPSVLLSKLARLQCCHLPALQHQQEVHQQQQPHQRHCQPCTVTHTQEWFRVSNWGPSKAAGVTVRRWPHVLHSIPHMSSNPPRIPDESNLTCI